MAMSPQERGKMGAAKRWQQQQERQIAAAPLEAQGEVPKYQVNAVCYHKNLDGIDRIYDPESTPKDENGEHRPLYLETWDIPAWYMEPVNDSAKAMVKKYNPAAFVNPVDTLTRIPTDVVATA